MRGHYFRNVPFSLQEPGEVELLGWLLAIPRSRQAWAVKQALRLSLSTVAANHFGITEPVDVAQALAAKASRGQRRRAHPVQPAMAAEHAGMASDTVGPGGSEPARPPLSAPSTPQAPDTPPAEPAALASAPPLTAGASSRTDKATADAILKRLRRLAR